MAQWLSAALVALLSFGLWGFFTKITIVYIDSKSALVYQTLGVVIIGLVTLWLMNFKLATNLRGASFGLLTGLTYGIGCLFYFMAATRGKIMTVVTLTALYPLITIILSYFLLREMINMKQWLGILLALLSIYLMAS